MRVKLQGPYSVPGIKVYRQPVSKAAISLVVFCLLFVASLVMMAQAYMVSKMMRGEPALDLLHLRDDVNSLTLFVGTSGRGGNLTHEQWMRAVTGDAPLVRVPMFEQTKGSRWIVRYTCDAFVLMVLALAFGASAVSERNRELGMKTAPWPPIAAVGLLLLEIWLTSRMNSDLQKPRYLGGYTPPYSIQNPDG